MASPLTLQFSKDHIFELFEVLNTLMSERAHERTCSSPMQRPGTGPCSKLELYERKFARLPGRGYPSFLPVEHLIWQSCELPIKMHETCET